MPLNPTTFNVKDAAAADKSMIAFNDGSKNTFAHPVLDADGALINPATAGKQDTANTSLATVATNTGTTATGIGTPADAAAGSDTGTFGVIAFIKRGMQNWATLLARVPALVSGRIPVDGSGVTQPVSAASLPLPTGAATSANQATSNTSLASIDGKLPALDNAKVSVVPSMTSGGNISAQTAATGTNWTAFASQALKQLTVSNQTGVALEFRQGGAGVGFQVPNQAIFPFYGITNANQIEVRRVDTSNTQATVTARWEA